VHDDEEDGRNRLEQVAAPAGGSPTGVPTGPVAFAGKLTL